VALPHIYSPADISDYATTVIRFYLCQKLTLYVQIAHTLNLSYTSPKTCTVAMFVIADLHSYVMCMYEGCPKSIRLYFFPR
jgi:hypothetical protein